MDEIEKKVDLNVINRGAKIEVLETSIYCLKDVIKRKNKTIKFLLLLYLVGGLLIIGGFIIGR